MRISSFASSLLVAPLLLALAPRADELSFHPSDGSKLTKQFTIQSEMELGDVTLDLDGQDFTGELPDDVNFGFEVSMQILDHYVKVANGKPLDLLRTFVHFSGSYHAMEESDGTEARSELDDKAVRFKWNEAENRYDVSANGEDAPEEIAAFLGVDMDLRSLLPGKSVSQGDAWNVDGKQLAVALIPGIDLDHLAGLEKYMEADADPDTELGLEVIKKEFLPQLEKLRDQCKTTCEYAGQREVDDHTLAAIKLKLDLNGTVDMSGFMRMAMTEAEIDESDYEIDEAALQVTITGEGELLWDLAAGSAHAFEFTAKLDIAAKLAMSVSEEGETADFQGAAELTGKCVWTMELK